MTEEQPLGGQGDFNETTIVQNLSFDMNNVEDDSVDDSQASTTDLNQTLQEEIALRKKLEPTFDVAQVVHVQTTALSFHEKIAHFEKKVAANRKESNVFAANLKESNAFRKESTVAETNPAAPQPQQAKVEPAPQACNKTSRRLQVFLRVRPLERPDSITTEIVDPEGNWQGKSVATKVRTRVPENSSSYGKPGSGIKEFEFNQVFGPKSSQLQVYERTAASLVSGLCTGNRVGASALLFCYGITNAGKTYTVLGDTRNHQDRSLWGIVPRCLNQLLQKVSNTDLKVYLSYLEIYNDSIFDLLPQETKKNPLRFQAKPLRIRENNGKIAIQDLSRRQIESIEQGLALIQQAKEGRHTATNHLNRSSSRSHCVCQLTVCRKVNLDGDSLQAETNEVVEDANLWIVDLAGSERTKRTNAGTIRQREASFINKSLMTLMGCLTRGEKNYRNSKLTLLFMHHWIKSGATSMIVNLNPSSQDYDENQHVLAYAISTKTPESEIISRMEAVPDDFPEYGYDGRRKVKNGNAVRKKDPSSAVVVGKKPVQRKPNGPEMRKRKVETVRNQTTKENTSNGQLNPDKNPIFDQSQRFTKKQKVEEETKALVNGEIEKLKSELVAARSQIVSLRAKNDELEEQVELKERSVREEVADEILGEMSTMRQRYETTIAQLRPLEKHREKIERAEAKEKELAEQVQECEEEMARSEKQHREEKAALEAKIVTMMDELKAYEALKTQYRTKEYDFTELKKQVESLENEILHIRSINSSNSDIATGPITSEEEATSLRNQLSEANNEIAQLKRSKAELVESYEQLLRDGSDSDDDTDGPTPDTRSRRVPKSCTRTVATKLKTPLTQKRTRNGTAKKVQQLSKETLGKENAPHIEKITRQPLGDVSKAKENTKTIVPENSLKQNTVVDPAKDHSLESPAH